MVSLHGRFIEWTTSFAVSMQAPCSGDNCNCAASLRALPFAEILDECNGHLDWWEILGHYAALEASYMLWHPRSSWIMHRHDFDGVTVSLTGRGEDVRLGA